MSILGDPSRRSPLSEEEEKAQTQRIIMRAAKLLGVEPDTLTEEEAGKALQDMIMRGEDIRIRKAIEDTHIREV